MENWIGTRVPIQLGNKECLKTRFQVSYRKTTSVNGCSRTHEPSWTSAPQLRLCAHFSTHHRPPCSSISHPDISSQRGWVGSVSLHMGSSDKFTNLGSTRLRGKSWTGMTSKTWSKRMKIALSWSVQTEVCLRAEPPVRREI